MYAVLALTLLAVVSANEKYTTKYDNVKLEDIMKNDRLLDNYFKCIMDQGKCTPDGEELKKNIPDALENECSKCSEKQKTGVNSMLKFLIKEKPEMFKQMEEKYDKEGKYRQKYKTMAAKEGIKLQ